MKTPSLNTILIVGGLGAGAYILYKIGKGAEMVGDIAANELNPTSDNNLAYQAIGKTGEWVTGDSDFCPGCEIAENPTNPVFWIFRGIAKVRGDL